MNEQENRQGTLEAKHSKQKLLAAARYSAGEKDVLSVILDEQSTYSHEQVKQQLQAYSQKEVM
ncbi:hypothetical protein ABEW34_21915 [Paenibacillus algorifonticola]|uniref:hypothetical protein n=1 Tax=Paenibacillus algorifonticola TaxID=684063 RepID=UPI003D2A9E93